MHEDTKDVATVQSIRGQTVGFRMGDGGLVNGAGDGDAEALAVVLVDVEPVAEVFWCQSASRGDWSSGGIWRAGRW